MTIRNGVAIYPSRMRKFLPLLECGVVLSIVLYWVALKEPHVNVYVKTWIGKSEVVAALLFLLGIFVIALNRYLFFDRPTIIVDSTGVNFKRPKKGMIDLKWSEIKEIYVFDYEKKKYLGIEPNDRDIVLSRLPNDKVNEEDVPLIMIDENMINISLNDLCEIMQTYNGDQLCLNYSKCSKKDLKERKIEILKDEYFAKG